MAPRFVLGLAGAVLSPGGQARALPLTPPPIGLPQLQQQVSCPALQARCGLTGGW
jgi:hypothetical protein